MGCLLLYHLSHLVSTKVPWQSLIGLHRSQASAWKQGWEDPSWISRRGVIPQKKNEVMPQNKCFWEWALRRCHGGKTKQMLSINAYHGSIHFSHSVVSDSLQPHGPQHARLPHPSPPTPGSLLKLMSVELVMPSNHFILCCPLLLPSIFPSIRVFFNESVLHIRWPKCYHGKWWNKYKPLSS